MNAIEAEVVPEQTQALAIRQPQSVGLFGNVEPVVVVERATKVAQALKDVIRRQGLISKISGKEYPRCEAWTLLGTMLGVFPVTVWTKEVEGGWEARVEARTKDGAIIGAAEAQCLRSERNWSNRDDFALRSMAQTRATAKCLRMPLGFVMTLAGYEATPAEEMVITNENRAERHPGRAGTTRVDQHSDPAAPRQAAPAKPAAAPTQGKLAPTVSPMPPATEQTRAKMIRSLENCIDLATEYFQKLTDPAVLLPNETLEQVPLQFVPRTLGQMRALQEAINRFGAGEDEFPQHAFRNDLPPETKPAKTETKAPPAETKPAPTATKPPPKDDEAWRDVIVPVPPKGVRRADYMVNPDTIGSLYDQAKSGTEEAGKRLFGFVKHFEPKPWIGRDDVQRPPSDVDVQFRKALDDFADWHERHGNDSQAAPAPSERKTELHRDLTEEEETPFD